MQLLNEVIEGRKSCRNGTIKHCSDNIQFNLKNAKINRSKFAQGCEKK